jgi:hypothetical protein
MITPSKIVITLLLLLAFATTGVAGGRSHTSSSASSSGSVHVSGYYRQKGTYVAPYNRRASGTATDAPTQTAGTDRMTLAERIAAENPTPKATLLPKIEVEDQPLPKGFSTVEDRRRSKRNGGNSLNTIAVRFT